MQQSSGNKIKKICLAVILMLLLAPLFQEYLNFFHLKKLQGYFVEEPNVTFYKREWLEGRFQEQKEKYINQHFGFRSLLIRVKNQLDFSLYDKINAEKVVYGKDGVFYEEAYIKSYLGIDFFGEDSIKNTVERLKVVQESLASKNKLLLIVMAPGKGSFYPHNFPNKYAEFKKTTSNYDVFSRELKAKNINTIDFNKWYKENKGKTKYPLMTELGIHWTIYGATFAFDSIAKYTEAKRNIDMPDIVFKGFHESDTLWSPDNDIYEASNLLFNSKHQKTAYPIYEVFKKNKSIPPSLLTIADSFWWNIYNTRLTHKIFKDGRFWYYNKEAYPESFNKTVLVSELDFNDAINKADVIVFCFTESNLNSIGGNGFLQKLQEYCNGQPINSPTRNAQKISEFINYIKSDPNWMESIKNRSKKEKTPVDTLIYRDAKWQVENNGK